MNDRKAQTIVDKLNAQFPGAHAMVWNGQPMIGEQSEYTTTFDGEPITISMVSYYAAGTSVYPNGVVEPVETFIESLGLYHEWYDSGTMVLYEA